MVFQFMRLLSNEKLEQHITYKSALPYVSLICIAFILEFCIKPHYVFWSANTTTMYINYSISFIRSTH